MKYFMTFVAAVLFAVSCTDLTSLESEIDRLADKIAALEGRCDKMNNDIDALSRLIEALKKEDMVTSVMPITLTDGTVEGYVVNFLHSGMVTIYNGTPGKDGQDGAPGKDGQDGKPGEDGKDGEPGKDGEDGKDGQDGAPGQDGKDGQDGAPGKDGQDGRAPVISVKKASDGKYYWTADGEWVLDEDGARVEVDMGNEPPMLKVEHTSWYISYDGGKTWSYLADYSYEEVGYVFSDIDVSDSDYVRFTLSDGSVIELPRYKDVSVNIECTSGQPVAQGSVVKLSYSVTSASEVAVLLDDSDIASGSITEHGPLSGEITLCLKQSVKVTSQRAFIIFKIDDREDDWWMVTFDGAGKVIVTDIR